MALSGEAHPALRRRGAPAVFLDKDGTVVEDVPYNVDPRQLRFTPHAVEALRLLQWRGYRLVMVTNQPGLALGRFDTAALNRLRDALMRALEAQGVTLDGFYACPHAPHRGEGLPACGCRKPAPGLITTAASAHGIDLSRSWMVGDILDDVEAGHRAGCRTVLLDVGHETVWHDTPWRRPSLRAGDLLEAAQRIVGHDTRHGTPATAHTLAEVRHDAAFAR